MPPDHALVADLRMDLQNPRLPGARFKTDEEAIHALMADADISELLNSIGLAGWQDFEPPIVDKRTNTVVEGNRRLAALKILADPALAARLGATIPDPLHPHATPQSIRISYVNSRREARDFIGFKHVNGAKKWDSYAKARFAAEWIASGDDIETVSRRLGDGHNTVSRLVNGIIVLEQSEVQHLFQKRPDKRFYFSHLYTAVSHNPIRRFLGLPEVDGKLLPHFPVSRDNATNLKQLMEWLYGSDSAEPVIRTQNPDLNRLVKVLSSERATRRLYDTNDLGRAFEEVTDKGDLFKSAFLRLQTGIEEAHRLAPEYRPKDELLEDAQAAQRRLRGLIQVMKTITDNEDPE